MRDKRNRREERDLNKYREVGREGRREKVRMRDEKVKGEERESKSEIGREREGGGRTRKKVEEK